MKSKTLKYTFVSRRKSQEKKKVDDGLGRFVVSREQWVYIVWRGITDAVSLPVRSTRIRFEMGPISAIFSALLQWSRKYVWSDQRDPPCCVPLSNIASLMPIQLANNTLNKLIFLIDPFGYCVSRVYSNYSHKLIVVFPWGNRSPSLSLRWLWKEKLTCILQIINLSLLHIDR